jgi:hypothetical protein
MALIGVAALALSVTAVEAAPRKRVVVQRGTNPPPTVFTSRDENGRVRTKLLVQKRSYLDGGTEVLPGQRHFTDYANPPYYSPLDVLGPGRNYDRSPLNPRWELGGFGRF